MYELWIFLISRIHHLLQLSSVTLGLSIWSFQVGSSNIGTCKVGTKLRADWNPEFSSILFYPNFRTASNQDSRFQSTAHVPQTPSLSCEELHNRPLCLCCSRSTWQANWRSDWRCVRKVRIVQSLHSFSRQFRQTFGLTLFAHLLQSISGR